MENDPSTRKSSKLGSPLKKRRVNLINKSNDNPSPEEIIQLMENYRRSKEDMEILSNYCKRNESLMTILQINTRDQGVSNDIFIHNLVSQFEYTYYSKGKAMFNFGDIGDKFYLMIRGEAVILIPQERNISLTYFDYLAFLKNLYKAKEITVVNKCLESNSNVFEVDIDLKLVEKLVFGENEQNQQKNDMKKESSLSTPASIKSCFKSSLGMVIDNFSLNPAKKMSNVRHSKRMFTKRLIESQMEPETGISIDDYLKVFNNPENLGNDLFLSITPIKIPKRISSGNVAKFSPSKNECRKKKSLLKNHENYESLIDTNYHMDEEEIKKLKTEKKHVKIFKFVPIKTIKDGESFGDIALQTTKNKRTATVFTTKNSSFLFLVKNSFDETIGEIHQRIVNEKIQFLKTFLLFKYCQHHYLLENYYYYLTSTILPLGGILVQQNETITQTAFIKEGTFEIYLEASVQQVYQYLKTSKLGLTELDTLIFDHSNNPSFQEFLRSKKRFSICKVSSGEYIGFDYEYLKSGKSLITAECVSHSSEILQLKNFDLCRLLSDYNNCIFSAVLDCNPRLTDKDSCTIDQILSTTTETMQGTSFGNFLDNFSLDVPKNPVHRKYLELNQIKAELTIKRIGVLLKKYFRVHFETNNIYTSQTENSLPVSMFIASKPPENQKQMIMMKKSFMNRPTKSLIYTPTKNKISGSFSNISFTTYNRERIISEQSQIETEYNLKNLKLNTSIKHQNSQSLTHKIEFSHTESDKFGKTAQQNSMFITNKFEDMQNRGSKLRKAKLTNYAESLYKKGLALKNKKGENLIINLDSIKSMNNNDEKEFDDILGKWTGKPQTAITICSETTNKSSNHNLQKPRTNKRLASISTFSKIVILEKLQEEALNLSADKAVKSSEANIDKNMEVPFTQEYEELIVTPDLKKPKPHVKKMTTLTKNSSQDSKINFSVSNIFTENSAINAKKSAKSKIKSFDFTSIIISECKGKEKLNASSSEIEVYRKLKDNFFFDKQNYLMDAGIIKSKQLNLFSRLAKAKYATKIKNNLRRKIFDSIKL